MTATLGHMVRKFIITVTCQQEQGVGHFLEEGEGRFSKGSNGGVK